MGETKRSNIFSDFFNSNKAGGILLLICVCFSLAMANSGAADWLKTVLAYPMGMENKFVDLPLSVGSFINDGLMSIFFPLVGLEIKRELKNGELSTIKNASLPVLAAVGGMLVPALLFVIINASSPTLSGWGIPMATDIAFALAIIALLGKKVPLSVKIFLTALAIVDDLGAILVIAIFYTNEIHLNYLFMAGMVVFLLVLLNVLGVRKLIFYLLPGILLWYFIHHSGIHATIAGVMVAFTIPALRKSDNSPLEKLEHFLHRPVNFLVMPLFAIANTNITFNMDVIKEVAEPLGLGIIAGLFVGKTIGITLFSWIAVKLKMGILPTGATWRQVSGSGMVAGIGFTMSIFISLLSFSDPVHIESAKISILIASVISGLAGYIWLNRAKQKPLT